MPSLAIEPWVRGHAAEPRGGWRRRAPPWDSPRAVPWCVWSVWCGRPRSAGSSPVTAGATGRKHRSERPDAPAALPRLKQGRDLGAFAYGPIDAERAKTSAAPAHNPNRVAAAHVAACDLSRKRLLGLDHKLRPQQQQQPVVVVRPRAGLTRRRRTRAARGHLPNDVRRFAVRSAVRRRSSRRERWLQGCR